MVIVWVPAQRWWALTWWWMGCVAQRVFIHLSVISWTCFEELRCLWVRGGWSEYFLGLWRHSCGWMPLEDTHRWDWACLNIIHSGWESLSRVMWWGLRNVSLSPLSVVSMWRSIELLHSMRSTSHYQCAWIILEIERECPITQLNGSQFRHV